ncbi:hypothetical protein T07_6862 [Trichinella nelsoni]|uniref:Uncharacterized protein n=1 Tax=Trichinella nelsoni TaxID=6336 RepID=A0A0V0RXL3_9BILA|nr:hypothetical protein T07_6862 [Trichinella nelsoni]
MSVRVKRNDDVNINYNYTSHGFLSDDDTDILRKARAWIAKHRQDYSLAFSTSDDPCEVLYDTAKRQLRWIRREYRLPYLIKKNYVRVLRKMKRVAKRNIRIKRGTRRCTVLMKLFLTDSAVEFP